MAPPLKDPARRRRTNKVAGARTLQAVAGLKTPTLPVDIRWHPRVEQWWAGLWSSPMAPEYDESDVDELLVLAVLYHQFWMEPSKDLAGEIRLQRQCFGKTPMDRRRLQWDILKVDAAKADADRRQVRPTAVRTGKKDPRRALA
jgi:hypothetical protein